MGKDKHSSRSWTTYLAVYLPAAVIAVVGFLLAYRYVGPPPPKTLTLATGAREGAYYQFGQAYAEWLAEHGIELKIVTTAGSVENLRLLEDGTAGVDLAFVQGGTGSTEKDLYSLGSLYYEPLWILHRRDLELEHLYELKDHPIALGAPDSGTRAIAEFLARENGIDPATLPDTPGVAGRDAVAALRSGTVDAAFFVASPEAPLVKELLADADFALLDMDRADAYASRNSFLTEVHLAEGMIDLERNIPPAPVTLISPAANLVVRKDVHPALSDLVLQAAAHVHGDGGLFERPGEFPAPRLLEFPLSPEADRYYEFGPPFLQRYLPFWIATVVDRLKVLILPLLVLLIPLSKVVPPTLRWGIRRKIFRWYKEIRALDVALSEPDASTRVEGLRDEIDRIEREVTQVNVPLGYADQLYNLRLHVDLVKEKCDRR